MAGGVDIWAGARAIAATVAVLAMAWGMPARGADLPDPTIIDNTPAPGAEWAVDFVFDDAPNTDYASDGGGIGTFIVFDFGQPTTVDRVVFTDRLCSGGDNGSGQMGDEDNVTAFDLTFSDDLSFGDPDDVVVSASSPPCCDTVSVDIPAQPTKRYARWQVTASAGGGENLGASDFLFQGSRIATATATGTDTETPTSTLTETPTATRTSTATATDTATATATPSVTPTRAGEPNGGACADPADCLSGNCVDDVCCAEAVCPPGESCNNPGPGNAGICSPDPVAPAPAISRTGLLLAIALVLAIGGAGFVRRRGAEH
jgi:hypothetical protein